LINYILEDREKRYNEILAIIDKYKVPVICGKINYPGNAKNTPEAQKAFQILKQQLENRSYGKCVFKKILSGEDGNSILIAINLEPLKAKKVSIDIEVAHPLGRIFDIDVYAGLGESIGREKLGLGPRKCIICGEDARVCMRAGSHSIEEVVNKVNQLIRDNIPREGN